MLASMRSWERAFYLWRKFNVHCCKQIKRVYSFVNKLFVYYRICTTLIRAAERVFWIFSPQYYCSDLRWFFGFRRFHFQLAWLIASNFPYWFHSHYLQLPSITNNCHVTVRIRFVTVRLDSHYSLGCVRHQFIHTRMRNNRMYNHTCWFHTHSGLMRVSSMHACARWPS